MKNPTIREIASKVGVSPSAVFLAINGKKGVSEKTRRRIVQAANEMGYVYHGESGLESIAAHSSRNIAVVLRSTLSPVEQIFYGEMLTNFIFQECDKQNLVPFLISSSQTSVTDALKNAGADGVLALGDLASVLLQEIEASDIPTVTLDSSHIDNPALSVQIAYDTAAYLGTMHLLDLGHRDIMYIGDDSMHDFNILTFRGYQKAIDEAHLLLPMDRVQIGVRNSETLHTALDTIIQRDHRPSAILCATDAYALLTIRYLHENKVRVPDDISIVGIDDLLFSHSFIPALTTVHIDTQKIVHTGISMLIRAMNREPCQSVSIPDVNLVVRESTREFR